MTYFQECLRHLEIFYKPLLSHPLTFSSPNHSGPCTPPILWFAAQALFSDTSAA